MKKIFVQLQKNAAALLLCLTVFVLGAAVLSGCDLLEGNQKEQVSDSIKPTEVSVSDEKLIEEDDFSEVEVVSDGSLIEVGKTLTKRISCGERHAKWNSSDENVAAVDDKGNITGVSVGSCTVKAMLDGGREFTYTVDVKKVCYLTFDDGPSAYTKRIVDALEKNNAKATFFVVYKGQIFDSLKDIKEQGSLVAMHSYSHDYSICYKDMYSYAAGIQELSDEIYNVIGEHPSIVRFPGGSNNLKCTGPTMRRIIQGMEDMGYKYFDWTSSSGDSGVDKDDPEGAEWSVQHVSESCHGDIEIVLMHEKKFNISAVDRIVKMLRGRGYIFETLDNCSEECHFNPVFNNTVGAQSVAFTEKSILLNVDESYRIYAQMMPEDSTEFIRFSSSDTGVAEVNIDGTVIGMGEGTAVITAVTTSGRTDECRVTVKRSSADPAEPKD